MTEPILVGRERELKELQHCLDLAIEGKGTAVFVSAEAGIGKTRLVHEFLKTAKQKKDIILMTGWCLFNAGVPYFPFIEAFSGYYSALCDKSKTQDLEVNSWLKGIVKPEIAGERQYLSPQALKDQTFVAVAETIRSIVSRCPIILLLEDIHWADSASLALVHYIARVINNSERVLLLATFRSENLNVDSEGYPHQLVETLSMMRREDLFSEINLLGLDKASVSRMAESMLGGCVHQSLAEELARVSEGNPLFVVESLNMLHEQDSLVRKNNEWRLEVEDIEIPNKIREIIIQRLARLNNSQRKILDIASVIGDKFDAEVLSAIVDQDRLDILEILNSIVQSTSIIYADEDSFHFDHAQSREIIYGAIAKPLRQAYHSRTAEKLNSKKATLPLSDLAYHYAQAGNKEKAVKYALAAGQDELARGSSSEAIKHFDYVLQTIKQDPELVDDRERAMEGLGDAYFANGCFQKATLAYEQIGDTAKASTVKLRAFRKAIESAFFQANPLHILEIVKKAEPYTSANRLEKARILCSRSRAFMLQKKEGCAKDLEDALEVFEQEYSLWDVAWASREVAKFHVGCGKDHQGLAEALRSIAIFEEIGDIRSHMESCYVGAQDFIRCQLNNEALELYEKITAIYESLKVGEYVTCWAYSDSGLIFSLYKGDLRKGLSCNLKALELSEKTDLLNAQGWIGSHLVVAYSLLGDINRAEESFEKLMKLPQEVFNFNQINGFEFAKAMLLGAKGEWEPFEKILGTIRASTAPGFSRAAEVYYEWALKKQGRFENAREVRESLDENRGKAEARFEHANLQASLIVRRHVVVGEDFEMRLDMVNVSRKPCVVVKIVGALPSEFKVISLPSFGSLKDGALSLKERVVGPFKVETVKLKLKATKAGNYNLLAEAIFVDDLGNTRTFKIDPVSLKVKPFMSKTEIASIPELRLGKIEFKSEAAEKAFNYLTAAFEEDHQRFKLVEEKSGWRTLTEISKNAQIPMYSLYGRYARGGKAKRELELLDLIESKFLVGERGRGGRVLKIRIRRDKLN